MPYERDALVLGLNAVGWVRRNQRQCVERALLELLGAEVGQPSAVEGLPPAIARRECIDAARPLPKRGLEVSSSAAGSSRGSTASRRAGFVDNQLGEMRHGR